MADEKKHDSTRKFQEFQHHFCQIIQLLHSLGAFGGIPVSLECTSCGFQRGKKNLLSHSAGG